MHRPEFNSIRSAYMKDLKMVELQGVWTLFVKGKGNRA